MPGMTRSPVASSKLQGAFPSPISAIRPSAQAIHPRSITRSARIVLADRVIERGWIACADGRIAEIGEGNAPCSFEDATGDLVMPGMIELHTDHLEAHYVPRPKVFWDPVAAVVSYDGQLATCGITTVLDSLRVWREVLTVM